MKIRKLAVCLVLSLTIIILFAINIITSYQEMPVGLSDMYGDTSGIHNLLIDALISDRNNNYSYTITLNSINTKNNIHVNKSNEEVIKSLANSYPYNYSYIYPFEAKYIPVGETKSETAKGESMYKMDRDGEWIPLPEHRIYAEIFEVIPVMTAGNLPLMLNSDKNKLFISPNEKGYIYDIDYNGEHENSQEYNPGFTVERSAYLHSELTINEKHLIVPTGKGFYGHTALYIIDMSNGYVPTTQAEGDNQVYIIADELYPIELEHGDEILGLIKLDNGILLAIQRSSGFEFIRIDIESRTSKTLYTEGKVWLNKYYLNDDSLVLISNYIDNIYPDVHAFDLIDGGIEHVMSVKSANIWGNEGDNIYYEVKAAIWKNEGLYVAVNKSSDISGIGEVLITALAPTGELIGRCRLLCGVEEDYMQFITRNKGIIQSAYVRELRSITLR